MKDTYNDDKNYGPEYFADLARQAEKEEKWQEAMDLWFRARARTLGHNRAERYREAEKRCERMLKC